MDHATTLNLTRVALGAAAWAAPGRGLRAVGLDAAEAPFLVRLFGARDAAFGVLTLLAEPHDLRGLLRMGIALDASDAAAALIAVRSGSIGRTTGALVTGSALGAVATGVLALRRPRTR